MLLATLLFIATPAARAAEPIATFKPDPASVQRFGAGYRYPQAGWVVLHVEGKPYERGEQGGRLLAPEIVGYLRACATEYGSKSPEQAWKLIRTMVNALFVRQFEPEYLEEMKGIADGAAAGGAKFDGRPIDLVDIVALNCWPEFETLDDAVEALPTGLEGKRFKNDQPKRMPPPAEGHCSAFAATGPATADGKIVFGHITMWNLRLARYFNVWLDVQPDKGHRVLMQSFPGGIQSGTDYYTNSAGLLVTETTIRQTHFDVKGMALAGRIRKVMQYADSIDAAVDILKASNNGLYANEWLLADTKTNEIAMFELGTHHSRLYRSSKSEWYGGAEGFYWGCNNTKDLQVRLETIPGVNGRPENMVWKPTDRDRTWMKLYTEHKGKIDANFGRLAFTTPPLNAIHSLDAKFTTSEMAKRLESFAVFGPPGGTKWEPTKEDRDRDPLVKPLVANSWTVLGPARPPESGAAIAAVDLHHRIQEPKDDEPEVHTSPAWHGTILPKTDADVWLATGFAEYERIVALEKAMQKKSGGKLTAADRDRLAVTLNVYRARLGDARRRSSKPLPDDPYWIAAGEGVLILHHMREKIGTDRLCDLMDGFGRANAGKKVATGDWVEQVGKKVEKTEPFFGTPYFDPHETRPVIQSFDAERERTLIVYGTGDEEAANRLTADALQEVIRTHWSNQALPIKPDKDMSDEDIRGHNLLLIGRPDCNSLVGRFRDAWPVKFGSRSFAVRGETYANAGSAILASALNPLNPRYSMVVLAGLSADATTRAAPTIYDNEGQGADVLILPAGGKLKAIVAPRQNAEGRSSDSDQHRQGQRR
jgi:hypothetical protein